MLPDELERVADSHVPGAGAVDIHRLSHGVVNDTYRVLRDGTAYAMRVAASNPCDSGFDRAWEARVIECAVPADLAPVMEYCDPQRGILISRWALGRSWNPADVRRRSGISRMAELLRRVHALPMPAPARLMNAKMWIDYYSAAACKSAGRDPDTAAALRTAAIKRLAALAALRSVDPVVCHSDLHILNLIDRGDALLLLDWEYAHAADPFWDLAGWSANNDLGDELQHDLLVAYNGRPPTPSEQLRLNLSVWLYDYVCLLWCELYLKPSAPGAGDAAQDSAAARAGQLAARLIESASSRAG